LRFFFSQDTSEIIVGQGLGPAAEKWASLRKPANLCGGRIIKHTSYPDTLGTSPTGATRKNFFSNSLFHALNMVSAHYKPRSLRVWFLTIHYTPALLPFLFSPIHPFTRFFSFFRFSLPLLVTASGCRFSLPFLVAVWHEFQERVKLFLPIRLFTYSPIHHSLLLA
jgi:hypothetical protein